MGFDYFATAKSRDAVLLPTRKRSQIIPVRGGFGQANARYLYGDDGKRPERALKKAILHRKNSLFYKTENGAEVGDLFMSLIHTSELNGANPFDYLTELQKHRRELFRSPAEWMPWNYRNTLERGVASREAPS
jgi:hypothetical protein